jgi:hypothetical protein
LQKVSPLNLNSIAPYPVIPILNQSSIIVGNATRQGTTANAWAYMGRRRLPQSAAADLRRLLLAASILSLIEKWY